MDLATITNNQSLASITDQGFSRPTTGCGRFHEQPPHYLDACFLCKEPLGCNRDIFMYRGDLPFCSVECREEQIEIDESKEKKRRVAASVKGSRKKDKSSKSSSDYAFHSGAVVAP